MRDVEKRRGGRLLCAGLVEVRWADTSGSVCTAFANLDDLSPGGVSLLLDRPLPPGARVEFTHSGQMVSGDVRHCTHVEIGWIAGIRFGPDSQWDPGNYPPAHLLDPSSVPENARLREGPSLARETRSTVACLALGKAVRRGEE
jgi:hypothetical protein